MSVRSLTGELCAYCQTPVATHPHVACGACGVKHHQYCWQRAGRCATPDCAGIPVGSTTVPPPPMVQTSAGYATYPVQQTYAPQGIYMEGDRTLVVQHGAMLPPVCVVTGRMQDLVQRTRKESWAPEWLAVLILVGVLIYVIVYEIIKKSASVTFYLDRAVATRRTILIAVNWVVCLGGFGGFAYFAYYTDLNMVGLGFLLLALAVIVPIIIFYAGIRLYGISKIENGYMWIRLRKPEVAQAIYNAARGFQNV